MSEKSGSGDVVFDALKIREASLAAELKTILDERNTAIHAAKAEYAEALKEIKGKQGALKRMMKTATEKL